MRFLRVFCFGFLSFFWDTALLGENYNYACSVQIDILGNVHMYEVSFSADIDFRNNDHFIFNDALISASNAGGIITDNGAVDVEKRDFELSTGQARDEPSGIFVQFYRDSFTINFDIQVLQF